MNDKSIVGFDGIVTALKAGSHKDIELKLYTGPNANDFVNVRGPYFIVNGGYLHWRVTMSAYRLVPDPNFCNGV